MKRVLMGIAVAAFVAAPAAAQVPGMPVWNSPKGGTGLTLAADLGKPSEDGSGTVLGAHASFGLANLTLSGAFSRAEPEGVAEAFTSMGGMAAFRIIGGSLLPVAVNLQLGAARTGEANGFPATTRLTAGVGVSTSLPTPGLRVEPYVSLGNRWSTPSGLDGTSSFGWTLGANVSFGMFGVHVAYDHEDAMNVIGIGAHFSLRAPIGL